MSDKKGFVDALVALCIKHNVKLTGWGNGSPRVSSMNGTDVFITDLKTFPDGRFSYYDNELKRVEANYDEG